MYYNKNNLPVKGKILNQANSDYFLFCLKRQIMYMYITCKVMKAEEMYAVRKTTNDLFICG